MKIYRTTNTGIYISTQIVAHNLENDYYPHSYKSAIVAEYNGKIIGMSLSYPSHFHEITDEMKKFFQKDRIEHFKHYYSVRFENSPLIDALSVHKEFRRKGIGSELISLNKEKAKKSGYEALSLINKLFLYLRKASLVPGPFQ
ncbi:MAG: GNAT family N-acetyltransferase [Deltaproteobacteria bacterium]|nr:GNAT family N-acetyltransferase [Deltaproteobacteria bacterium]